MPDTYISDDFPFTVEDWTDSNRMEVIAVCRSAFMANAAAKAHHKENPTRKIVARWGRSHTTWRWDREG